VLQVVLSLNPGGTERLVVELARRLHRQIPMAVCCLDEQGAWATELTAEGIPVEALHRQPGFVPRLSKAIAAMAARHRATVAHCHHYSPFVYGGLSRVWRRATRVVYTEHGRLSDAPPSSKRRIANAALGRLPSGVFAVSNELREHLLEEGFAPARAAVIYNGIDIGPLPCAARRADIRRRLGVGEETFVVGTIARLDPVKDLGTLLDAVSRLARGPISLVMIGDGPERQALERRAAELGIADRVRFLGQRNDAREWLAGCDVYVNCSISEGVSLTILEAMAAGLPVIATRVGGTPEVVDVGSGKLIPARDAATLASALVDLRTDVPGRSAMGRAARQRVEAHFTLDRMVEEYRRVYERLS